MGKLGRSESRERRRNLARRTLFGVLFLALLAGGCATGKEKASPPQGEEPRYAAVDARGVKVAFAHPPKTVVALTPSDVEVLFALGLDEEILAVGEFCNYPDAANQKKRLGSGQNTSVEQIIALKPELLFLTRDSKVQEYADQAEKAGIKVFVTSAQNLAQTYDTILATGTLVGKKSEAEDLVENMKNRIQALETAVAARQQNQEPVRVYFEVSPLVYGLWTCGQGSFQNEALELIGAQNIFRDITSWQQVSEEEVIVRNPQVIVTSASDYGVGDPVAEIKARPNWQTIEAIRNGRVYLMEDDTLARPAPRLVEGIERLYQAIYEEGNG